MSIDINTLGEGANIAIHPIYRVDLEHGEMMDMSGGYCGLSFLNIIMISKETASFYNEDTLLTHERIHSTQWRSLGATMFFRTVKDFLDIEGQAGNLHGPGMPGLEYQNKHMWKPPLWWPSCWSFISITTI